MKPANIVMNWGAQLMFERPVRKLGIHELILQLEQSTEQISEHLETCSDTPANHRLLSHLIGIERWGQRRIRVALGEPFLTEEYDHYRPPVEGLWDELIGEWEATRQATVDLASNLTNTSVPPDFKISHNQFGPLSIKGWLRYLDVHASSEGKHFK
jgi:hypothetical protein